MNYKILVTPQDKHVLSTMRLPKVEGRMAIFPDMQSNEIIVNGKSVIEFFTGSQELFDAWCDLLTANNCWFQIVEPV